MSLFGELANIEPELAIVINAIASAVSKIAATLRTPGISESGGTNAFGDKQLLADVQSDKIVFDCLRESGAVATASSEESSDMHAMGGAGYSVAFDPLDGSSIIAANFAVGSIFGIWAGSQLIGRTGRDQSAAVYSIYGSRTILVVARPRSRSTSICNGGRPSDTHCVQEFALSPEGEWTLVRQNITLGETRVFAPANLRATADNAAYAELVQQWMQERYTLRYSGGMVPDVHHILTKGGGVFCSPKSHTAPAKLRLLYECAPLAFVVEAAGGASHDGVGSSLSRRIDSSGDRSVICLGSPGDVARSVASLQC